MIYYFIIISFITYFVFYIDKKQAIYRGKRISEKTLLFLSFIGGAVGGYLAMKIHRHKTKKLLFTFSLPIFIIFHIVILYFLEI